MRATFSPQVGQDIPPVTVVVTRQLIDRFSAFANDRNPVHLDDAFARSRGFPGAIAHGAIAASFLLRMLTQWLVEWPLDGDELEVTFIAPVLVDSRVTARGQVTAVHAEGFECEVWCEGDDGKKLMVGKARVGSPRQ